MRMLDYMEKHEDFDRYITGKMSDEERKSFNEEIEKDAILRAELHLREDLSDGIKRRAEKLEKIQEWEKSYTKEKNGRIQRLVWSSVSVAAAGGIAAESDHESAGVGAVPGSGDRRLRCTGSFARQRHSGVKIFRKSAESVCVLPGNMIQ
jgi:hypothetical protein